MVRHSKLRWSIDHLAIVWLLLARPALYSRSLCYQTKLLQSGAGRANNQGRTHYVTMQQESHWSELFSALYSMSRPMSDLYISSQRKIPKLSDEIFCHTLTKHPFSGNFVEIIRKKKIFCVQVYFPAWLTRSTNIQPAAATNYTDCICIRANI